MLNSRLVHIVNRTFWSRKMPYYAVRRGKNPGIYNDWDSCKQEVIGFSGARYKKFSTEAEAEAFVNDCDSTFSGSFTMTSDSLPNESSTSAVPTLKKEIKLTLQVLQNKLNNTFKNCSQKRSYCDKSDSRPSKRFKKGSSECCEDGVFTGQSFSRSDACVYTDGSCKVNGQYGAHAGIGVYWGPDHPSNVSERLPGRQTNNRAEIHAARKAIQQAKEKGIKNLTLKTDSRFLIDSITSWMQKWKQNGWKLSNGNQVINREDFEQLDQELQGISVKWVHTRGHIGIKGNEAADRLANQGALKRS